MAIVAYCGESCSVTSTEWDNMEPFSMTFSLSSTDTEVRAFADAGDYSPVIVCNENGTIEVASYLRPALDLSDTLTFAANVGGEALTWPVIVTGRDIKVDAASDVQFTIKMRITGDAV